MNQKCNKKSWLKKQLSIYRQYYNKDVGQESACHTWAQHSTTLSIGERQSKDR